MSILYSIDHLLEQCFYIRRLGRLCRPNYTNPSVQIGEMNVCIGPAQSFVYYIVYKSFSGVDIKPDYRAAGIQNLSK